jgi:hypothetical protein
METTLAKHSMSENEMLHIYAGAGKCANGATQATLLVGCAILGFFNPGVWVAGTAYFYYCNPQS